MINKLKKFIYTVSKIKNNKYLLNFKNFIKSISFLKYIILISLVFFSIYLIVPKFINSSKRVNLLKNLLIQKYNFDLEDFESINYKIFPRPQIVVSKFKIKSSSLLLSNTGDKLKVYLRFKDLINFDYLNSNSLLIENSKISIDVKNFQKVINYLGNLKKKILIKDSEIIILDADSLIVNIKNFNFENKNFEDFKLEGLIFGKKIKINLLKHAELNKLTFSIPSLGSKTKVILKKNFSIKNFEGNLKSNILSNKISLNFKKGDNIIISDSLLSNKTLSSKFKGIIEINPYFNFDMFFDIRNISNIESLIKEHSLQITDFIKKNKKLNGNLNIVYESKKYQSKFIKQVDIKLSLENREIKIPKLFLKFDNGQALLSGMLTEMNGFQIFEFDLRLNIFDKRKLAKFLGKKKLKNSEELQIKTSGQINIFSDKINFKEIIVNKKIIKDKKIIMFYKKYFENVLKNNELQEIISLKKIKEISQKIYQ